MLPSSNIGKSTWLIDAPCGKPARRCHFHYVLAISFILLSSNSYQNIALQERMMFTPYFSGRSIKFPKKQYLDMVARAYCSSQMNVKEHKVLNFLTAL